MDKYMFHKAARDGYLDLLRETTRKDCNKIDEDGMSPTLWAAYYGNLDALRMLVGRGGNPDKCDYFGSSALHLSAANGHMNCVTFLVSFGTNLWALDNELHTALDVAAMGNRTEIIRYLDSVCEKQAKLNKKLVKKWKEKAVLDAQKRIKRVTKLQSKAQKRAEKEDLKLAKMRERMGETGRANSAPTSMAASMRSKVSGYSGRTNLSEPKPYSAHLTLTSQNKKFLMSGVAKKIKQKHKDPSCISEMDGDFKIGEMESDGKRTVRSLSGLKRDPHVMYVRGKINGSLSSTDSGHSRDHDLFNVYNRQSSSAEPDAVSRALSEPDFFYNNVDSGIEMQDEPADRMSMFERPGFGSVSFMKRPMMTSDALLSFPPEDVTDGPDTIPEEGAPDVGKENQPSTSKGKGKGKGKGKQKKVKSVEDTGSIGTVGSLAARIKDLPWDDDDIIDIDDLNLPTNSDLQLFLAVNNLSEYYHFFRNEDIDLQAMMLLTEGDLKELGLPMGPRRKLLEGISRRRSALEKQSTIVDTVL